MSRYEGTANSIIKLGYSHAYGWYWNVRWFCYHITYKERKMWEKMKNDEEIKPTLRINIIIVISFLQSFMWKFYGTIINNIVLTFPSSCKIYKIIQKKIDVIHYSSSSNNSKRILHDITLLGMLVLYAPCNFCTVYSQQDVNIFMLNTIRIHM